ncbi:hypothetical protein GIB67_000281 [Kingdonia uniflora]|uniref:Exocyst complex component Sec8 n=1 Tax=Kingdonia uniflora TaxID=39325 RepID=A0A7J7LC81_9MAGN|nr:hypothetical protein GIB67_000281 [Kingdonia uniflora]
MFNFFLLIFFFCHQHIYQVPLYEGELFRFCLYFADIPIFVFSSFLKQYLREDLSRVDESWAAARFDSLPHVVHILTSKDREGEVQLLKEQSEIVEEVVDEVVHAYHSGFNKAIQNYSQILRLFSESAESIAVLKVDLAEAKKFLGSRNKQLHQLWYRSVTLRHIISLLDQIEGVAKVPARIENLIAERQYYAAVQLHAQSTFMLEKEGLQAVGALQDVRSELTKLRGVLFYKVLEDLHSHLYNKGDYSSAITSIDERDDEVPTTGAGALSMSNSQPLSRRTRLLKGENQFAALGFGDGFRRPGSVDGSSYDGHDDDSGVEIVNGTSSDGLTRVHGGDVNPKDAKIISRQIPMWLAYSTPNEFLEAMKKSDAPLHVKYLQTMVECLCMLGKVAAAGAMIWMGEVSSEVAMIEPAEDEIGDSSDEERCVGLDSLSRVSDTIVVLSEVEKNRSQRLRPTIHEIITSKIKAYAAVVNSSRAINGQSAKTPTPGLHYFKEQLESYQLPKQKRPNEIILAGTLLAVSPVSPVMAPSGAAQAAAKQVLDSILDNIIRILENHVIVGELLESKSAQQSDLSIPKSMSGDIYWNPDPEASQLTGGYSVGFSLTVLQEAYTFRNFVIYLYTAKR